MMSEVAVAWLLLDAARIAEERLRRRGRRPPRPAFYLGKRYAARFFALNVLPGVVHKAQILEAG
jgi:hypothetical protein